VGKIVATYLAKITLREHDDLLEGEEVQPAPTITELTTVIENALETSQANLPSVTAERTDR
jgi:hypothetical protein